jgi:cytoskeletal protein RodZ
MSQMAPEPAPAPSGNVLTRKVGPLPTWAWLAISIAGGVGFIWWRNHKAASSAAADSGDGASAEAAEGEAATDDAASVATLQSEIQQLQGDASKPTTSEPSKVQVRTVPKAETLAAYGRAHKWGPAGLKAVEALNGLSASSRLKKGQRIVVPG